ncbi:thiol reductant ABC exporter subunit CydD [Schaalia suimastitidis]|uniref:thiol reductant ABC exporter subunit CydD n=1 Tax=Schaalia suimastitidis TaxID=121163 RepID=UPI00047ABDDC|nr:thiol reductant ABC exporter subunit CydD [Schaalia suimastitidis]
MRPLDPRLMRYARSARRYIIITAILGVATAALVIIQALLISGALAPVVTTQVPLQQVVPVLIGLAATILVRSLIVGLRERIAVRAADQAIRQLRDRVLTAAIAKGPRWLARHGNDTTTLLTRGLDDLAPYFIRFLPQLILVCTVTPLALLTILILDFWSAVVAAFTVPLIPIFMALIGRFTQESSQARLLSMQQLGSQLLDLMAGLPTLRALGREDSPRAHLKKLGEKNTRITMSTLKIAFLSGGVLEFLATLSVALVAVEVGMRMVYGNISLFAGLAVIMLAPEVFEPLRQVGAQFHASANGVAAAQAAFEIIDDQSDSAGSGANATGSPRSATDDATLPPTPCPDLAITPIHIDDLSIAARSTWAPAHLTATITPGTITVLSGHSGAGKSTTVAALLRLLTPSRGTITVGNTPLEAISRADWWTHVAWIPQVPTVLPGTLADNIGQRATTDELTQAATATGFDKVLASLEHGWDTCIGHGGTGLSIGQRQRFALTRLLLSPAQLIIFDEPTAHLDAISEDTVVATLKRLSSQGKTVLVIAHSAAVRNAADHVINVTSAPASADDIAHWPELTADDATEVADFELPELLAASQGTMK